MFFHMFKNRVYKRKKVVTFNLILLFILLADLSFEYRAPSHVFTQNVELNLEHGVQPYGYLWVFMNKSPF